MRHTLSILGSIWITGTTFAEDPGLSAASAFLEENRLVPDEVAIPENYDPLRERVAARRDPESQFGRLLFALARPGTGVLDDSQLANAANLIEARQTASVNWHDVRNIIRVRAMMLLFDHAVATDPEKLEHWRSEWEAWTDLRQDYMFQEFVAQERFQRAFWNGLSPEQQRQVGVGELDSKFKKSIGHSRSFFADRIVTRTLGKPDHPEAFESARVRWEAKWVDVKQDMEDAARFNRQREFAMNEAGEAFALAAWKADAPAFRQFATAERDAIRDLVQAGYEIDEEIREKVREWVQDQLEAMQTKYRDHGAELLKRLGHLESP